MLFLLCLVSSLFLLELPVQYNYFSQAYDMQDWHKLSGIDAEILIIGNSRSWRGMDASLIESSTGKRTYVLAQDGSGGQMLVKKYKHYQSQNNPPEIILVQSDHTTLRKIVKWRDKKYFLKYLFLNREGLHEVVRNLEGYRWWEFAFPFLRYQGNRQTYLYDAAGKGWQLNRIKGFAPKGFAPLSSHSQFLALPFDTIDLTALDFSLLEPFKNLECRKKIAFFPPLSTSAENVMSNPDDLHNHLLSNGFQVLAFTNTEISWTDSLFYDHSHTNDIGTKLWTKRVIDFIQEAP